MSKEPQLPPPPPAWPETDLSDCGFVFGTAGDKYTALAHQAARSVRETHPNIPIDIFTDQPVPDGIYSKVHKLNKVWFRPKFEALLESRFDRTIYLDADLVVVGDISDVFWTLKKYDIAAAQAQNRNQDWAYRVWRQQLPNSFPQINAGVLGVRKNARTQKFLTDVQSAVDHYQLSKDQPTFREFLWSSDVSLCVLPSEYNLRRRERVRSRTWLAPAPRVLHDSRFFQKMDGLTPPTPEEIYGKLYLKYVRYLHKGDQQLSGKGHKKGWRTFFKS